MSVTEAPSRNPLKKTKDGYSGTREFNITGAIDKPDAFQQLFDFGLDIGLPYQDSQGNTPYPTTLISSLEVGPPPSGREVTGGSGSYYGIVTYTDITGNENGSSSGAGQLIPDGPALWSSRVGANTVQIDIDIHGSVIANSAAVPFQNVNGPVSTETLIAEWIVSQTSFQQASAFAATYNNTLNSSPFIGRDTESLWLQSMSPRSLTPIGFSTPGLIRYQATFVYKRPIFIERLNKSVSAHLLNRVDKGRQRLNEDWAPGDDPTTQLIPITHVTTSGKEAPVSQDIMLDGNGQVLEDPTNPIILFYDVIPSENHNSIGIP